MGNQTGKHLTDTGCKVKPRPKKPKTKQKKKRTEKEPALTFIQTGTRGLLSTCSREHFGVVSAMYASTVSPSYLPITSFILHPALIGGPLFDHLPQ